MKADVHFLQNKFSSVWIVTLIEYCQLYCAWVVSSSETFQDFWKCFMDMLFGQVGQSNPLLIFECIYDPKQHIDTHTYAHTPLCLQYIPRERKVNLTTLL